MDFSINSRSGKALSQFEPLFWEYLTIPTVTLTEYAVFVDGKNLPGIKNKKPVRNNINDFCIENPPIRYSIPDIIPSFLIKIKPG
jgi:hypothetical protein